MRATMLGPVFFAAVSALAPDPAPHLDSNRIEAEVAVFARSGVTAVNPSIFGRWVPSPHWAVEGWLPFATQLEAPSTSVIGNLAFAGYGRGHLTGVGIVEGGLLVALPTARSDSEADAAALEVASRMSGYFDAWRYRPDTLWLALPIRFESTSAEGLAFWGEGRPFLGVPTAGGEAAGLLTLVMGGGYRTRIAALRVDFGLGALLLPELDDAGQLFVEPGARLNFARTRSGVAFLDVALRINLDEPAGFSFDRGAYAATARLGFAFGRG